LAQAAIGSAHSWTSLHRELETIGLAIEKTGRGGRLLDLEAGRHVPLGAAISLAGLEERLGANEVAPAVAARDARELARREAGLAERVELLQTQPELELERLAETRSVWSTVDVEREVRSTIGVRAGHDAIVQSAMAAVVGASVELDRDAYTPRRRYAQTGAHMAAIST
jgi:hypothetical protein